VIAPLPFPQPDNLVIIGGNIGLLDASSNRIVESDALDQIFSNIASYVTVLQNSIIIPETRTYRIIQSCDVTADFFKTLDVMPVYGYDFENDEGGTVIVSNRFWRNELNQADNVIGKITEIQGGVQARIIGIMPDTFDFPTGTDVWYYRGRGSLLSHGRQFLGRLQPEISIEQARSKLNSIRIEPQGLMLGGDGPLLQPLQTVFYGDRHQLLRMLSITSVLFLLLVCSGVMSIFVTQGTRRKSEMALRLILGASRPNLVSQLLREILPLVVVGTLAGLWLSEIAGAWLRVQFPILQGGEVVVIAKISIFAILVVATTIISGLLPALYASGINLNTYLKSGGIIRRRFFSLQELLVGVQLGLALALLISSGLLLRNVMFKVDVPVVLSAEAIEVARVQFFVDWLTRSNDAITYRATFHREFQHQLERMPEVASVEVFRPIPLSGETLTASLSGSSLFKYHPASKPRIQNKTAAPVIIGQVSEGGFQILGIPLVEGRYFSSTDVDKEIEIKRAFLTAERVGNNVGGVAIINQSLARQFWPGESAIGKTILDIFLDSHEVIGVVRDFHQVANNKGILPSIYFPTNNTDVSQTYLVQLHSDVMQKTFRERLYTMDTGLAYIYVQSLRDIVAEATVNIHVLLQLLVCFAFLGIVVAGSGVYATTTLMAAFRNREMGIRMAMGAQTWDIFRLSLWYGMRVILLGLPLGLFLAWILSRILSSIIFQLNTGDLLVWVISCVLLVGIVIVAALIPALRAIRVNPADVLRND
jgi:predicted permease